jgi:nucleoid-associated protein YgaU
MGVLDKIFGNDDDKDTPKADFSDVRSNTPNRDVSGGGFGAAAGNAAGNAARRADFSDVQGASMSTPAASERTYTVVAGDSLSKIAKAEYGDASKWQKIYAANKATISNPDLIHPGQVIIIPTDA